jgi:hypothetical protein
MRSIKAIDFFDALNGVEGLVEVSDLEECLDVYSEIMGVKRSSIDKRLVKLESKLSTTIISKYFDDDTKESLGLNTDNIDSKIENLAKKVEVVRGQSNVQKSNTAKDDTPDEFMFHNMITAMSIALGVTISMDVDIVTFMYFSKNAHLKK